MRVGAPAKRPMIFAVRFFDRKIVDAGKPPLHQAVRIEFPVFITVGPKPISAIIAPFVGKPNGNTVFMKGPQFFDKSVV